MNNWVSEGAIACLPQRGLPPRTHLCYKHRNLAVTLILFMTSAEHEGGTLGCYTRELLYSQPEAGFR
jgi:hypothetical protein